MKTKEQLFKEMYDYLNKLANKQGCNIDLKLDKLLKEVDEVKE